ncbi:hth DNA binding domain protein [Halosimplex carlsbadense 2-9-1]|uniref:Hth DNA binding domain protein n=1 Tax=Halosimplex carlsbadense 2-9-1 TaxID=797114 RepID=M0CWE9_9EURY|nr:helix-turn-helix domain-containing protein [Halosimplex carlsbadense]ELZ27505.1 hth DNA binding domain protein [Halosimplex carlsbadense 2-9-1]
MALHAEYHLGCDALPLVDVAAAVPDAEMELSIGLGEGERPRFTAVVTANPETTAAVEAAFESTAFVGEYRLVVREDGASRYTITPGTSMAEQLGDRLDDLDDLRALYETPVQIEFIRARPTGWLQAGRFADRAAFDQLREFWQRNTSFRLRKLTRVGESAEPFGDDTDGDGLTDAQREAIGTAHRLGYFEIPRTATLEDVAAELGISASSLSERLRRAQTHLVETHVEARPRPLEWSR